MDSSNRSSRFNMNHSNRSSSSARTAPLPEDGNESILKSSIRSTQTAPLPEDRNDSINKCSSRSTGTRRVNFSHVVKKSFTAVDQDDNSIIGLNSRGIAYYQTASFEKAAKLFEQAAAECTKKLPPALREAVQRRCTIKESVPKSKSMYRNMDLEGYNFYKRVFSISEDNNIQVMCNIVLYNAAQARRQSGDLEKALKHYQLSYFIYPKPKSATHYQCLHNVGQFFHCMVGPSDTKTLFKRCFGRGAEAWLLSREGSLRSAILEFQDT